MLDFYPMDGDNQVGFVEVPIAFEQWLIAVSGVSFEDVSLNILGEDEDGDVELIMDYDDYMNLCDLYFEYDTLGWMVLEDPDYVEEITAIPDYEAEDVENALITGSIGGEPAIFRFRKGEQDQTGFTTGRIVVGDEEELHWMSRDIAHQIPNYPERHGKAFKTWKKNILGLHAAEGSGDKMTFGRIEWRWDTDEEDVDEEAINSKIEEEIRFSDGESGSGTLNFDNEEGVSYEVYYSYDHVFSGYNTAETGYYAAEAEQNDCYICGTGTATVCKSEYCQDMHQMLMKGANPAAQKLLEGFEAPYTGPSSLFKFGDNQSALGGFTAKELTESSAIHGDFDSASLNYSGKQNLEVRQAEGELDDKTIEMFIARGYILSPNGDPTNPEHWSMPTAVRQPVVSTTSWKPEKGSHGDRFIPKTFEASGSGLSNKALAELIESQFWTDWTTSETPVNPGWWNLTISVRDFRLWAMGIKPNRFWKVSDAKKYFNIRGGKESLVTQIEAIQQFITGLTEGDSDATTQFQETVDKYFGAEDVENDCYICGDGDGPACDADGCQDKHYTYMLDNMEAAETFDAHARHNINRFSPKNNPRNTISSTRHRLKKQMWKDTTASVGVKGIAAIIAAAAVGVYYWRK